MSDKRRLEGDKSRLKAKIKDLAAAVATVQVRHALHGAMSMSVMVSYELIARMTTSGGLAGLRHNPGA